MGLRFDKSIEQEIEDFFASKNLDTVAQSPYIGLIRAVELLEKEGDGPAPANGNDAGSPGPAGSERLSSSGSSVNQPEPLTQDLLADAVTYESPNYLSDAESTNSLGPVTDLASPLDPFSIHPIMDLLMGNYYLAFTNESLSMATKSYAQILIGSRLFLTAMAIHLSLQVAPPDLQQGGNSRISYVHVPAARMSIVIYIATAINSSLFPLTKHPLFLRSSGTGTEIGAFSTLFTLVTGGFRGRPMWGTFRVWDARLTSVFILFLIYLGALRFQKLPVEPAPISIRAGPIDIPIIKSPVNWWNTSHQPGSISRSGTSIHVPMPIPILSNFANFPFSTRILFVLETRLPIPSFPESPLTEEIEAREGIPLKT
uniref:Cytochrome c biosynthesis ccmC-like mitochondrial protein, putative n=2 Tax=BOP clade TaxID=359160 RepID=Q2QPM0_ORYSJ|nr:Cytochrome c biosynthesis ccmC-like mitochondrial protein, putative [Oryza sativa Japonica Group]